MNDENKIGQETGGQLAIEQVDGVATSQAVVDYWFGSDPNDLAEVKRRYKTWFRSGDAQDDFIRQKFQSTVEQALAGKLTHWRESPESALAEIIVCDQFPRNIYRGTPLAFSGDKLALRCAQRAIDSGADMELPAIMRMFVYMPLEHAESRQIQEQSVTMFEMLAADSPPQFDELMQGALRSVVGHAEIIRKFGRFPHRNAILERESTARELKFLEADGRSYGQGGGDG